MKKMKLNLEEEFLSSYMPDSYQDAPLNKEKKQWHVLILKNLSMMIYQSSKTVSFEFHKRLSLQNGELCETTPESMLNESCLSRAIKSGVVRCLDNKNSQDLNKDFIKKAARYFESKAESGDFNEITLFSEPQQMKLLKAALPAKIKKLIKNEIELFEKELN